MLIARGKHKHIINRLGSLTVKKPYRVSRDLAKEVNDKYLGLMVTTEKVRCGRSVSEDLCSLSRRFLIARLVSTFRPERAGNKCCTANIS